MKNMKIMKIMKIMKGGINMRAYLIDEGILLTENEKGYENYATVYDKKYGYYDENQYYVKEQQKAIEEARAYVKKGNENTYAIVSNATLDDDVDLDGLIVDCEEYILDNVVYSVAKINGEIIEDFLDIL